MSRWVQLNGPDNKAIAVDLDQVAWMVGNPGHTFLYFNFVRADGFVYVEVKETPAQILSGSKG
jgi:hypothetical protein